MPASKNLKDLQVEWYQKLQDEGFNDIENVNNSNRPLKEWHSFKIPSKRFQLIQAKRSLYQRKIDEFKHHNSFHDACRLVTRHGNCKFSVEQIILIWDLHTEGKTTREIAKKVRRVKSRVDDVLKRLNEWMKLV